VVTIVRVSPSHSTCSIEWSCTVIALDADSQVAVSKTCTTPDAPAPASHRPSDENDRSCSWSLVAGGTRRSTSRVSASKIRTSGKSLVATASKVWSGLGSIVMGAPPVSIGDPTVQLVVSTGAR
jgi:hypothetical protein